MNGKPQYYRVCEKVIVSDKKEKKGAEKRHLPEY